MAKHLSTQAVYEQLGLQDGPRLLDVRSNEDFARLPKMIPGAMSFDAQRTAASAHSFPPQRPIALYASRAHDLGPTAQALAARGLRVSIIEGGIEGWLDENRPTIKARPESGVPGGSRWVTRERPKIDRIACPWLIRRFIDPLATFFYVPATRVRAEATALEAQPYDIPDVTFSHRGPKCSFDAFLEEFDLRDPIVNELAKIVRAADTANLDESREAPGLLAISLGLSASISDDQLLLEQGMVVYDALYTWCKRAPDETHSWPQKVASR